MKTFIIALLTLIITCQSAFADNCDWGQIKANSDGTYTYSAQLNRCVGGVVRDLKAANDQIDSLNKSITLKDLAIHDSDLRAQTWMNSALALQTDLDKIHGIEESNKLIYTGLGVLGTTLAVIAAGQLAKIK